MGLARSTQRIDVLRTLGTGAARRLFYLVDPLLEPRRNRPITKVATHVTPSAPVPVLCLMVYRARNADRARQLVSQIGLVLKFVSGPLTKSRQIWQP